MNWFSAKGVYTLRNALLEALCFGRTSFDSSTDLALGDSIASCQACMIAKRNLRLFYGVARV